jgi:hypothetical protein
MLFGPSAVHALPVRKLEVNLIAGLIGTIHSGEISILHGYPLPGRGDLPLCQ